ncbi:MAG TPA: hypothetical protein VKB93_04405 [Thermoanaerobaculia bacterium]|nr:hypothetical protein [Thermoanaerobaculia bacterium]
MRRLFLLLFLAVSAGAQEENLVRYLIPVTGGPTPGANGSLWTTELTVHNPRDGQIFVFGDRCGGLISSPPCENNWYITPLTSMRLLVSPSSFSKGAFIYLPDDPNYGPTPMTLRVRDLSKDAQNLGTEVPIVRMSEFAQLVIVTDVPTDDRYRATLRLYNSSEAPRRVTMRVFPLSGGTPIETRTVDLAGVNLLVFDPTPLHPGYAEVDPLSPLVRASAQRVRIEIEDPLRHVVSPPPPPIWGLVSITNNETQQVTMITPHP